MDNYLIYLDKLSISDSIGTMESKQTKKGKAMKTNKKEIDLTIKAGESKLAYFKRIAKACKGKVVKEKEYKATYIFTIPGELHSTWLKLTKHADVCEGMNGDGDNFIIFTNAKSRS
jgi:hypothetical protein